VKVRHSSHLAWLNKGRTQRLQAEKDTTSNSLLKTIHGCANRSDGQQKLGEGRESSTTQPHNGWEHQGPLEIIPSSPQLKQGKPEQIAQACV